MTDSNNLILEKRIVELYEIKQSIKQVSDEVEKSVPFVRKILGKHNVKIREPFKKVNDANIIKTIIDLFNSGHSVKAIEEKVTLSRRTITRILNDEGIKQRDRSESMYLRMSQTSFKDRQKLTKNANIAVRKNGFKDSFFEKLSVVKQKTFHCIGTGEVEFINDIKSYNFSVTPQKSISKYNIDILVDTLAVEIHNNTGHPHSCPRLIERIEYLLNAGFNVLYIKIFGNYPYSSIAANYAISFINESRKFPPGSREYRMIRGNGQLVTRGCLKNDHLSII